MDFNNREDLVRNGFRGFRTIQELWLDHSSIPRKRGVYLVINPDHRKPKFLYPGVGGYFKGKDPNVTIDELLQRVVLTSQVVYIGKAGSTSGNSTLNSRLRQYLRFGQGKNIGHWGGRYIWQLKNHKELILCWKETLDKDPREMEKILLYMHTRIYKKPPFGNLAN